MPSKSATTGKTQHELLNEAVDLGASYEDLKTLTDGTAIGESLGELQVGAVSSEAVPYGSEFGDKQEPEAAVPAEQLEMVQAIDDAKAAFAATAPAEEAPAELQPQGLWLNERERELLGEGAFVQNYKTNAEMAQGAHAEKQRMIAEYNALSASEKADYMAKDNLTWRAFKEVRDRASGAKKGAIEWDRDWTLSQDKLKELTTDLPEEYWGSFADANSEPEAIAMREQLLQHMEQSKKFSGMGGMGLTGQVALTLLDPAVIAASEATGGYAAVQKLSRLKRMMGTGALAGVESAAIEAYLSKDDASRGTDDMLYAGLGGLLIGSAIGGAVKRTVSPELQNEIMAEMRNMDAALASDLTAKPRAKVYSDGTPFEADALQPTQRAQLEDEAAQIREGMELLEEEMNMSSIDGEPDEALQEQGIELEQRLAEVERKLSTDIGTMPKPDEEVVLAGKARFSEEHAPLTNSKKVEAVLEGHENAPKTFTLGPLKFNRSAIAGSSANSKLRHIYQKLTFQGAGFKDGAANGGVPAEQWKRMVMDEMVMKWRPARDAAYRKWAMEQGLNPRKVDNLRAFNREIADAVEDAAYSGSQHVKEVAKIQSELYAETLGLMKNPSVRERLSNAPVKGSERFDTDPEYLNHVWRYDNIIEHGVDRAQKVIAKALPGGADDVTRMRLAKNIIETLRRADADAGGDISRWFDMRKDDLEEMLDEYQVTGEVKDNILYDMAKLQERKAGDSDKGTNMKRRMKLDMSAEVDGLRLKDLFERDAEVLLSKYLDTNLGRVAMARTGLTSDSVMKAMRAEVEKGYDDLARKGHPVPDWIKKRELKVLDDTMSIVMGRPLVDHGDIMENATRIGRNFAHGQTMGAAGFASLAEYGTVMGDIGKAYVTALNRNVPGIRKFVAGIKNGDYSQQELEDMLWVVGGVGNRRATAAPTTFNEDTLGKATGSIDMASQRISHITNEISGLNYITQMQQRQAQVGIVWKWGLNALEGSKGFSKMTLKELGIDDAMHQRITAQIRKYSDDGSGKFNGNLQLTKWDDAEAREMLKYMSHQHNRRLVQELDSGDMLPWNGWLTKTITHLRSFVLGATNKQFAHGMNHIMQGDYDVVPKMLLNSFAASMSWAIRVGILSMGRPDQERYLEENMTLEKMGKAAISRAGWTGLLPTVVDSGSDALFGEQVFNQRYSGMSNSILDLSSTPLGSMLDGLGGLGTAVAQSALTDRQWSQKDLAALKRLVFWNNAVGIDAGIRNINAALGQDLPRKSDELQSN